MLSVKGCESGNGSSGSVLGLLKRAGQSEPVSEVMTQTDVDRETYEVSL